MKLQQIWGSWYRHSQTLFSRKSSPRRRKTNYSTAPASVMCVELLESRAMLSVAPAALLVYYGYPSDINQSAGDVTYAKSEFAKYQDVVLGAGLEASSHPDHANTVEIVTSPTTANTTFFGYVDLGVSTNNYTLAQIHTQIDQWKATGVKGIFLDDFGYDFGVSRARQNDAIDYAHSVGLPVVANGFAVNDVFSSAVDATYNPNGTKTDLAATDFYFYESYQIETGSYVNATDWRAKADALAAFRETLPINVLATTTTNAATFDQNQFDYAWYSAALDGFTAVGWGEPDYSSNSAAPFRDRPTLNPGDNFTTAVMNASGVFSRDTNLGQILVDTNGHGESFVYNPSVSAPATASVTENTSLTFSTGNGNAISVVDAAAAANSDTLSLTVTHGTLALGSTTGLAFTSGSNGSASMGVSGTLANINAALSGLVFTPTVGYSGSDTLAISVNNGTYNLTGSANVAITVKVPPPAVTAPPTASLNENASLTFSTGNGNAISLADIAAVGRSDTLKLTVTHGKLVLGSTAGLTFVSGTNGAASMTIWGTLPNINAGLSGLTFTPTTGYTGSASLALLSKNGRDNLTGSANVALTVKVPPPVVTAPTTATVNQTASLTFSTGNGNAISLADVAAVGKSDTLKVTVTHGKLVLGSTTGLKFVSGTNGSASMTIWGTLANINAALSGLTFTPTTGYSGSATLALTSKNGRDNLTGSANVALTVNAPPPTVTAPATASVNKNASMTFSMGNSNAISLADVAAVAKSDTLKLTVTHGKLILGSTTGLTFVSGTNGSASMTVWGTLADINAALSGLTFTPTTGYSGSAALAITAKNGRDNLTGSANVAITIN